MPTVHVDAACRSRRGDGSASGGMRAGGSAPAGASCAVRRGGALRGDAGGRDRRSSGRTTRLAMRDAGGALRARAATAGDALGAGAIALGDGRWPASRGATRRGTRHAALRRRRRRARGGGTGVSLRGTGAGRVIGQGAHCRQRTARQQLPCPRALARDRPGVRGIRASPPAGRSRRSRRGPACPAASGGRSASRTTSGRRVEADQVLADHRAPSSR